MKKVFVGLSGGVDSAVSAALLKDQGYNVTGVFMKNWSRDIGSHRCQWKEDLASARLVAAYLKIPFEIYDFEKEYFDTVTTYMLETYKKGQTPNPDIMCNSEIKFKLFLEKCLSEGAEYVATGHYAQMIDGQLAQAKDTNKDQTYFLYRINPKVADTILFPLGNLEKPQVRKLAHQYDLPNAKRPDSQGLCFVGNIPMSEFLTEFITPKAGDIVDEKGAILGQHNGAFSYTIGQRHGLGIGGGMPYFVYKVDTQENVVHVTTNEDSLLLNKEEFMVSDCNWWIEPVDKGSKLQVRVRYRSDLKPCTIARVGDEDSWKTTLDQPERAIAPGQSAVFYNRGIVVGGGIIQ